MAAMLVGALILKTAMVWPLALAAVLAGVTWIVYVPAAPLRRPGRR